MQQECIGGPYSGARIAHIGDAVQKILSLFPISKLSDRFVSAKQEVSEVKPIPEWHALLLLMIDFTWSINYQKSTL